MESSSALKIPRWIPHGDVLAIVFLAAFPFVYFWQVTLGASVWFTTDVVRLFYPFGVELARALDAGRLPLWTPNLLAGFPLVAEGQVGALYPANLLLYKILPAHLALSYSIVLHLAWAGVGMFVSARAFGLRAPGALLAGFVFTFNGVIFGHLSHPSVIATMAWLPWLIVFQNRFYRTQRARWFVLTALAVGLQFLPGSAQLAFLNAITFSVLGVVQIMFERSVNRRARISSLMLGTILPLVFGAGLAAMQLAPTMELIGYSVRGETTEEFFTSYGLPIVFLAQVFAPFAQGEPAETTGEYWFYFGVAPFLLALLSPFVRRNRQTIFLFAFALIMFSFALGGQNPLYRLLYRLPIFGFFRVPARYLFIFNFLAAWLAAFALNTLAASEIARKRAWIAALVFGGMTLGIIALAQTQPLEFWLQTWQGLPIVLFLVTLGAILLIAARKMNGATFAAFVIGLTVFDLASFFPPFLATIDALTPAAYVESVPRSVAALNSAQMTGRVFTDISVFPSIPALRGSFFPASGLAFNMSSAQAYSSLEYARHQAYFFDLSPNALNLLNVQYWMIPLEPRPRTKTATPPENIALDLLNDEIKFAPIDARALVITSATEQAADLADGTPIAELNVRFENGSSATFFLRAGVETADWDHDRKRVTNNVQHQRAPVAYSFPAYWRAFGKPFEGHTFLARFNFAAQQKIIGVAINVLQPAARLIIESIALENPAQTISLAQVAGKNDFQIAYFSDTVAAWENRNVLPRAFVAHTATVLDDGAAFARIKSLEFQPAHQVILNEGDALRESVASRDVVAITDARAERVVVSVTTEQPGYLVLTDSWYPGWEARMDGHPASIHRANVLFRAVRIEPGSHTVEFEYRPLSFMLGAMVSVVSVLITIGISIFYFGHRKLSLHANR